MRPSAEEHLGSNARFSRTFCSRFSLKDIPWRNQRLKGENPGAELAANPKHHADYSQANWESSDTS
jgi:hypothetical protein